MTHVDCHVCQLGAKASEDQIVYRDDYWTVASSVAVPGWMMLFLNRHNDGVWELDDTEAETFGRLLTKLSGRPAHPSASMSCTPVRTPCTST